MSDDQLSQAQLLAKRRRERILGNTVNRLDLVTGKAEELKPAPEISARPETSPSSKKLPSSGQNFYRDSAPVRIFKWPSRLFLAFVFSCLLLSVIDVPWLFVKFFVSFAALEFVFYSLNLLHSNAGLRQYMGFLFVRDTFDSGLDEYLKLAVIFLGLQGAGARYFRSMVMHGLQSCADLGIFSTLFLIFVSFQSVRS